MKNPIPFPALAVVVAIVAAGSGKGPDPMGGRLAAQPVPAAEEMGGRIFAARCANCHGEETEHAPPRAALALRSQQVIIAALTSGSMRAMAAGLAPEEIEAVAGYLSVGPQWEIASPGAVEVQGFCEDRYRPIRFDGPKWNGFGFDIQGSRFQPDPGITADEVRDLRVKWAFALDGNVHGQPTVVGDRVFVSSIAGKLYSIDSATGCTYWSYVTAAGDAPYVTGSRSAVTVAPIEVAGAPDRYAAFIGDANGFVHAVDAVTGDEIWRIRIDTNPGPRLTGSVVYHDGLLYVPVSSYEEASAGSDHFECCRFRGNITAVHPATGEIVWKGYTIEREARPYRRNRVGTQMYGPAGGSIWSTPTIDVERGAIYGTSGNSYTEVSTDGANAVVAFDLKTGAVLWRKQVREDDNYIAAPCARGTPPANCPRELGPDFDFGTAAIVRQLSDGRSLLVAADKGGEVYALDAAQQGRLVWQQKVGRGSALGGVQWGMAADDEFVYVAVSDVIGPASERRPGLSKLRISDGEVVWNSPAQSPQCSWTAVIQCSNAMSAAVTLIPGVVFAGSLDGHVRAFSTVDGALVWAFDTARVFEAVNGGHARGGSLDGGGVVFAGGTMFMTSGYEMFSHRHRGNVLLAFTVGGL